MIRRDSQARPTRKADHSAKMHEEGKQERPILERPVELELPRVFVVGVGLRRLSPNRRCRWRENLYSV